MYSDAVVELPPFKRCFNALISCFNAPVSFSNASNLSGLLLLRNVETNRGRHVAKDCENDDEAHADGIFNARDDGPVRG